METVGEYLKKRRMELGLSLRDVCAKIEQSKIAGTTVSYSYYCQVENATRCRPEKITFDFFWAISCILGTDPVNLFIMSRGGAIPETMLDPRARKRVFGEQ